MERLAEHQMGAARDLFELGVQHLEALRNVHGPEEFWAAQTRFATQVGEKWRANAGKSLEVYLEHQAEVGRLFTEHMAKTTAETPAGGLVEVLPTAAAKTRAKGPAKAA